MCVQRGYKICRGMQILCTIYKICPRPIHILCIMFQKCITLVHYNYIEMIVGLFWETVRLWSL